MRRRTLGIGLALVFGLFVSPALSQEKVRLILDWVISGRHTPYFVALEKGFWKEGGLEVTVSRGFGGASTVKAVGAGGAEVGFADPGSALVARAKGAPIQIVSTFYGKAPFMFVWKEKTGIRTPKDLEGKTIGAPVGDANRAVFPAFAMMAGIDPNKVKWETMDATAKTPSLLADKVEVIPHFSFEKVLFGKLTAQHGRFNFMLYADHGLDIYSNGLQAQDAYITGKASALRAFVHGAVKGYAWAVENPKEANTIFSKQQPAVDKEVAFGEIDILRELVLTEEAKKHCIGWMSREKMARTQDVMFKALNVTETLDIEKAYTTKFLPCG